MGWKEGMYSALTEYLKSYYKLDIVEVIDFQDRTEYGGGCETCAYEYVVCDITYRTSKNKVKTYEYNDSFSSLIAGLNS